MMNKLILALFFAICTQLVWSVDNQDQLLVPSNIELALNDLTDTAHYELVKEYALSLQKPDYDQFIALLETRKISAGFTRVGFIATGWLFSLLPFFAAISHLHSIPPLQLMDSNSRTGTSAGIDAFYNAWSNIRDSYYNTLKNARQLSNDLRSHRYKIGCFIAFSIIGIMTYIDSRYAVTQQFHILSNLLNELKELHKAYDHQTF